MLGTILSGYWVVYIEEEKHIMFKYVLIGLLIAIFFLILLSAIYIARLERLGTKKPKLRKKVENNSGMKRLKEYLESKEQVYEISYYRIEFDRYDEEIEKKYIIDYNERHRRYYITSIYVVNNMHVLMHTEFISKIGKATNNKLVESVVNYLEEKVYSKGE